jgi:hypothetical protein
MINCQFLPLDIKLSVFITERYFAYADDNACLARFCIAKDHEHVKLASSETNAPGARSTSEASDTQIQRMHDKNPVTCRAVFKVPVKNGDLKEWKSKRFAFLVRPVPANQILRGWRNW